MPEHLSTAVQQNLITLLAHDNINGKLVANLVDTNLFEGDFRTIAERCVAYWRQYGEAPGNHTGDLFPDIFDDRKNRGRAQTYQRILVSMLQLSEGINTTYVIETLQKFTRTQRLKAAILESAEQLNSRQELAISDVEQIWNDLLRSRDTVFDPGSTLSDYQSVLSYLATRQSEFMTGVDVLDQHKFVPARDAVMLFLAPTGFGKSWWLINLGCLALLQRKKVLHVTLELSMELTKQRYYQAMFAVPKHHVPNLTISQIELDEFERIIEHPELPTIRVDPDFAFDSRHISNELEVRINEFGSLMDNIYIRKFPMRSLTVQALRGFIDNLEIVQGFIPDMLILDYIGIMKTDDKNHRISLGRMFEDFKGLCEEKHIAGVTAHQTSKQGAQARNVSMTHVAEDWSLTNTADNVLLYSCTPMERRYGLARLYAGKARSEEDKFGCLITQSYKTGQFCLSSCLLPSNYYDYLDTLKAPDQPKETEDGNGEDA